MNNFVVVIGGGLAGCEASYQLAKRGIKVKLYEMKPVKFSPAHHDENLAEIVCSNSFKSNLLTNACGLLKEELRRLDSLLIKIADECRVPAGQALAVDREIFARRVTEEIEKSENIEIIKQEVVDIEELAKDGIVIIATGPLTSDALSNSIKKITGNDGLHFYDAAAPIIEKDSIDFDIAFYGDRYEQEKKKDESIEDWKQRLEVAENNYINLPMNKEEYKNFCNELINAECVILKDFEKDEIFEGCMPIEVMAKRGLDTLRFGPLKPVGFDDPRTAKRPYAVVQLRQDNGDGTLYNMVGFQTNLKYGEQKRVFSMIPGLENADFIKYGVMHRNTFINSPELLDQTYKLVHSPKAAHLYETARSTKTVHSYETSRSPENVNQNANAQPNETECLYEAAQLNEAAYSKSEERESQIYFAGQITGVEGYVESISSGLVAGINAAKQFRNEERLLFSEETMIGALAKYISSPNKHFQPMNANFGILPELEGKRIKDKKARYQALAERSLEKLKL